MPLAANQQEVLPSSRMARCLPQESEKLTYANKKVSEFFGFFNF